MPNIIFHFCIQLDWKTKLFFQLSVIKKSKFIAVDHVKHEKWVFNNNVIILSLKYWIYRDMIRPLQIVRFDNIALVMGCLHYFLYFYASKEMAMT